MVGATTTTAGMIDKPPRLHPPRKKPKLSTYLETLMNFRPGFSFCLQPCLQNISGRTCAHVDFCPVLFHSANLVRVLVIQFLLPSVFCLQCCVSYRRYWFYDPEPVLRFSHFCLVIVWHSIHHSSPIPPSPPLVFMCTSLRIE